MAGGTISSIDPPSVPYRGGEFFLTIHGTGLGDRIVFEGAPGRFILEPNAADVGYVISWVPAEIVNDPGPYTVYVTGKDGESNRVTFDVVKPGRSGLKLHLPEHLTAIARSRLGAGIKYSVSTTGGDSATTTVNCEPMSGSTFPFGQSQIKCVATDGFGDRDSGVIGVTVWDGVAPSLTIPKSFQVDASDERGAYVKFETSAYDDIDGTLGVSCLPEAGSHFQHGRNTVLCEAVDYSLNPAVGSFEIFVQPRDIGTLAIKTPDYLTEAATQEEGAIVFYDAVPYGSADPDPVVQCSPASGTLFLHGRTKVYCTAEDDFGQRAEAGFVIEVVERLGLKFADVTAEATSPTGSAVTFEPVSENWTNAITCTPASGTLFALGATAVECESTDEKGRRAFGTFKVNVADTIAPHIGRVRANAGAAADGEMVPVQVAVDATDAADAMPRCSVSTLTADDGAAFDWRIKGDLEVEVGAGKAPFRIQVSCVDASGNRATDSVAVSIGGTSRRRPVAN